MAHRPLPVGHHTADEVAELLGKPWTKRRLYQRLREMGWLIVDRNGVRGGNHNLPRQEIVKLGWAYPFTCTYGAGEDKQIDREYRIPVFTQSGYQQIKKVLIDGEATPEIRPTQAAPPPPPEDSGPTKDEIKNDPRTRQSREEALANLRKIL